MTSAAIDLGGTSLRAGFRGRDGFEAIRSAAGADAVPAAVWLAGSGDARAGEAAMAGPPGEVITSVRADLRTGGRDRYFHGRFESPDAVAGYLLAYAARRVAAESGERVRDVVLGVPIADDGDEATGGSDEAAIRRAAAAAGLTVSDTIAEPVAAALHYGAVRDGADHVTVVHDLGGTSLDVTVLRISGRNVAIAASGRDAFGGADWDEALARDLLAQADLPGATPNQADLRTAERLRIGLGTGEHSSALLAVPDGDREVLLDRARMEEVTANLVDRAVRFTRATVGRAVGAGCAPPDTVLLAGGASLMPAVARALGERLDLGVHVSDPQLAVVRGLTLARDFGLLFVTGQDSAPLDVPAPPPVQAPLALEAGPRTTVAEPAADDPEPTADDPEPPAEGSGPVATDPEPEAEDTRPPTPGPAAPRRPPEPPPPPPPPPRPPRPRPAAGTGGKAGDHDDTSTAGPPGVIPVGGTPPAGPLTGRPVGGLTALRRVDWVLLTWVWPDDSAEAQVRWHSDGNGDGPGRGGSASCSRRRYEHDGGFEVRDGGAGLTVTVEAMVYGDDLEGAAPSALVVEPATPAIRYLPSVRRRGWSRWIASVTFTSDIDCSLPEVLVVRGTGNYMPASVRDGEVVYPIPSRPLTAGVPETVMFELKRIRGGCWLVCLPADTDTVAAADLRPASLHRLRVS